ncbi:MAG: GldG family protein [Clostridia bacterium]|nr:GldG family protein [Clostridia bacterium]
MEENKNLTPETETQIEEEAVVEVEPAETAKPKKEKPQKPKKAKKDKVKLIKSQFAFKRGSYSLALTAAVLAGLIVINILVTVLADRFNMEFDMSTQKTNSMSEENIEFLRNLEQEVNITFCADKESYASGYMAYYAQQYGVSEDASNYYAQTLTLVEKYADYNKNIKVQFIDTQSTEFSAITQKYTSDNIGYGDILVSAKKGDNEKHKVVGFKDIYNITEDDTYAAYGMTTSTVSGNNIETALTGAIAYVTSTKTKKLAILTGHSKTDYTADLTKMLAQNNYEVAYIKDELVTTISNEFDAVMIASPVKDFIGSEIEALSKFLDNDGKLNKGLMFFADIDSPYLTNLYDFLSQWGIDVGEGILFETNQSNHIPDDPMTIGTYPIEDEKEDITKNMDLFITGYNVPLEIGFETRDGIAVTPLVATPESVVAAPVGISKDWAGASEHEKKSYPTIIQAVKEEYNDDNELMSSYVVAFSSIEYFYSAYNAQASVSNNDICLAVAERLVRADKNGVKFTSKTITNESFAEKVTESSTKAMHIIFMILLPIL